MSLLDSRQRAMLAEMGVRVWAPAAPRPARREEELPEAPPAEAGISMASAPKVAASAPSARPIQVAAGSVSSAPVVAAIATPTTAMPPAVDSALRPEGVERMGWPQLEAVVAACQACGLCEGRTNTVFGVGSQHADWMVVGEAPGENEDRQGEPFVGQAGKLLDNMLAAVGLSRQAGDPADALSEQTMREPGQTKKGVYIANVLKCRPPGNRNPQPEEIAQCEPYLRRQVALLRPKIILAMGRFAVQSLLQTNEPIGRLRGRVHHYEGVPVIVTYHPAYLLRALQDKSKAWDDLCLALEVAAGAVP